MRDCQILAEAKPTDFFQYKVLSGGGMQQCGIPDNCDNPVAAPNAWYLYSSRQGTCADHQCAKGYVHIPNQRIVVGSTDVACCEVPAIAITGYSDDCPDGYAVLEGLANVEACRTWAEQNFKAIKTLTFEELFENGDYPKGCYLQEEENMVWFNHDVFGSASDGRTSVCQQQEVCSTRDATVGDCVGTDVGDSGDCVISGGTCQAGWEGYCRYGENLEDRILDAVSSTDQQACYQTCQNTDGCQAISWSRDTPATPCYLYRQATYGNGQDYGNNKYKDAWCFTVEAASTTPEPAPLQESTCAVWCPDNTEAWATKCTWTGCGNCPNCAVLLEIQTKDISVAQHDQTDEQPQDGDEDLYDVARSKEAPRQASRSWMSLMR